MSQIKPTITSLSQLNADDLLHQYGIAELTVFPRPYTDLIGYRNGQISDDEMSKNFFPNTVFHVKKADNSQNCLMVVVGESWVYGGKIRDMHVYPEPGACTETADSFELALTATMGAQLANAFCVDLYQDAYPGNNTSDIFDLADKIVQQYSDKYEKIIVVLQITDSFREESQINGMKPHWHCYDLYHYPQCSTPEEWSCAYEEGFLKRAEQLNENQCVDQVVVWKNFSPWVLPKSQRQQYNCVTVEKSWTNFLAELEGVELPDVCCSNEEQLNPHTGSSMANTKGFTWEYAHQQFDNIEKYYDYREKISPAVHSLCVHYPSIRGHELWALYVSSYIKLHSTIT